MAEPQYDPEIKFFAGEENAKTVKLLFDKGLEREGRHGLFYKYTVDHLGVQSTFIASKGLHEQLKWYSRDAVLKITKEEYEPNKHRFEVDVVSGDKKAVLDVPSMAQNTPKKEVSQQNDTSLQIKWGMALNNATKIVIAKHTFLGTTVENDEVVREVEELTNKLFKVACSMPTSINEDDVPF